MQGLPSLFLPAPQRADRADAADFLRVFCVGFIGWYHIWQQSWLNPDLRLGKLVFRFYPLVSCGYMFVDLMLLLSGFLLMLGFLNGRDRTPSDFYISRAARILPSYWLGIAVMLFAALWPQNLYASGAELLGDLLPHLTFTHNFFYFPYLHTKLNGVLWTLAVEVQFYLLFPWLARAFERKPILTYLSMTAFSLLVRLRLYLWDQDVSLYFNRLGAMLDVYANGMAAAVLYLRLGKKPARAWRAWLSTGLTIISCIGIYCILRRQMYADGLTAIQRGQMAWRFLLSLLGGIFLVCGSRSVRWMRSLFSNRLIRFLSGISFNFYIWHQFLALQLKKWRIPPYTGDAPNVEGQVPWQRGYTALCFLAALLAAVLVTYLVEKPCARLIKRRKEAAGPVSDRISIVE